MVPSSKESFEVAYVVSIKHLRAPRARAHAKRDFFFHGSIYFAETVPMRYRTPLGGFPKCVLFRRQGGRQGGRHPDRENRHYENIYIDVILHYL